VDGVGQSLAYLSRDGASRHRVEAGGVAQLGLAVLRSLVHARPTEAQFIRVIGMVEALVSGAKRTVFGLMV
jgi:hypothetical protein